MEGNQPPGNEPSFSTSALLGAGLLGAAVIAACESFVAPENPMGAAIGNAVVCAIDEPVRAAVATFKGNLAGFIDSCDSAR